MVISFGPEEITEIFDMRMVLEEHAGYVATPKRTDAEVARVGEMLWKIGVLKRANAGLERVQPRVPRTLVCGKRSPASLPSNSIGNAVLALGRGEA
jgi:hypothetical protein